ncbi:MAG TPA: LuxR C-terminal-related transcriptional regulator [Acidimicrobiales bacterium]|nr:LuxR C-terminal-related transcriptional regulator [Acidimicrobiales bacterium]
MADLLNHVAALADPDRRQQALAALGAAGPARMVALRQGLSHPGWRVRRWACRLLEDETLDALTSARLIAAAKGDPHKKVRRQALLAVVWESCVPAPKSTECTDSRYDVIGLLLERLRNDRSVSVRRAAATGLMLQVTLNGNRQPRVQRGLQRAMAKEADETIRRRAREALDDLAAAATGDTYRALRWALEEGRVQLALRLVRGHMRRWEEQGTFGEARMWLDRVLMVAERAPPPLLAPLLHDAGFTALVSGDFDAATSHLRASVAQWDLAGDRINRLRSRCALAFLASFGADASAIEDLEAEVDEVRADGDDASLFEVLAVCGQARMFRGTPEAARGHFEEALALARHPQLEPNLPTALVCLASAELRQGDYGEAESHLVEALRRAEASGDEHTDVIGRCWLAELEGLRGDSHQAAVRAGECLHRARAMSAPYPLAMALLVGAGAVLEEGDPEAARALFEEASTVATRAHLSHLTTAARIGRGQVALTRGDVTSARRLFDLARTRARLRGNATVAADGSYHLGQLARTRGHLRRAASLHDEALALRDKTGDRAGVAESLEALAGLAAITGKDDKAARLFGAAQALRQATGCARRRLSTETYEADVAMLARRMERADFDATWAEGAALMPDEAVWQARRGRGPRHRPPQGWDALTPAQRRVTDLVAQGLTNAQVAEQLCLGPETVKSHVAKVFDKLGMSSRWELRAAPQSHR